MVFILLSPSKTLRFENTHPQFVGDDPYFSGQALKLAKIMGGLSQAELSTLMGISGKLAALNAARFDGFRKTEKALEKNLALFAFHGDTFRGVDADTMMDAHVAVAQKHLGILSGLYGVLQPFDLIQPYRLEMGTPVRIGDKGNLYEFWGNRVTKRINDLVARYKCKAVIGGASAEYLKVVQLDKLSVPFIQCEFREKKAGGTQIVAIYAKKARGMLARYIVDNDVKDPAQLQDFRMGKYKFDKKLSRDNRFVFVR